MAKKLPPSFWYEIEHLTFTLQEDGSLTIGGITDPKSERGAPLLELVPRDTMAIAVFLGLPLDAAARTRHTRAYVEDQRNEEEEARQAEARRRAAT